MPLHDSGGIRCWFFPSFLGPKIFSNIRETTKFFKVPITKFWWLLGRPDDLYKYWFILSSLSGGAMPIPHSKTLWLSPEMCRCHGFTWIYHRFWEDHYWQTLIGLVTDIHSPPIYLLIWLIAWFVYWSMFQYCSIYLSIYPSIHPSIYPSIYLWHNSQGDSYAQKHRFCTVFALRIRWKWIQSKNSWVAPWPYKLIALFGVRNMSLKVKAGLKIRKNSP